MYLINGQLRDDIPPESALDLLQKQLPRLLAAPIDSDTVIESAARFATQLQARSLDLPLDDDQYQGLIDFCQQSNLSTKLDRELGLQPRSLRRIDYRQPCFEAGIRWGWWCISLRATHRCWRSARYSKACWPATSTGFAPAPAIRV